MFADCQIHFTRATDFFRITQQQWSWRSIWRLNGSEDKTYHRGGQNDSSDFDKELINKTNVNIIIMLFYSCLFGA